jgi:DNA ligase 1
MKFFLFFLLFTNIFANNLQKAIIYDERKHNINGFYLSEKLDGVRAYWNGVELLSKNGNKIYAPSWFLSNFPPFELDGELWTKQGDFENIQSIVLSQQEPKEWENITYNIFEVPNIKGDFNARLNHLKIFLDKNPNEFIKIIPQIKVENKEEVYKYLDEVLSKNGEGVMLKNPKLDYFTGRSKDILKVKKYFDDECLIVAYNLEKNRLKSLVCEYINSSKNKIIFNLGNGFSEEQRLNPPKIGEFVTFKYYGFTKNSKPKFASFLRVRNQE